VAIGLLVALVLAACWLVGISMIGLAESGAVETPPGRFLTIDGARVRVREWGSGPPLVLLHGLPGSSADWPDAFVARLAGRHRVLAIDLAGLGYSERPPDRTVGVEPWAVQIVSTLDTLDVADAVLVGHDAGAIVAVLVAADAPRIARRLVLLAPAVPLDRADEPRYLPWIRLPGTGELIAGWSERLLLAPGAPRPVGQGPWWRIPGTRRGVLAAFRAAIDPTRLRSALRDVRAPTLVLHGTHDTVVPGTAMRRWTPSVERVLVRSLQGTRHWPAQEAPMLVADTILGFEEGDAR
jgi:pimeloyl-ACP methyl ester carboxylesterase